MAARWSEHLKKNKSGGVWSTPSYYGNSHLRLTYIMVVVKTAAKWTRSRSAFKGLGSFHVPAWTFASPLMSLFLLRFAPFFSVQPGVFFKCFYEDSVVLPELPESDVINTALNNNATVSNCSKHHDSHWLNHWEINNHNISNWTRLECVLPHNELFALHNWNQPVWQLQKWQ